MPRTIATLPAGSRITDYVSLGVCYGKVRMSPLSKVEMSLRSRGRYAPFPQLALFCITSSRQGYPSAQRQAALTAPVRDAPTAVLLALPLTRNRENGGTSEKAQAIAAHASPRTTKLYDRTSDALTLEEIEKIGS